MNPLRTDHYFPVSLRREGKDPEHIFNLTVYADTLPDEGEMLVINDEYFVVVDSSIEEGYIMVETATNVRVVTKKGYRYYLLP